MDRMLESLADRNVGAYVDDIYIFSDTIQEHLESLDLVLKTLQEHGMTVSLKKCQICQSMVNLLGFTIGNDYIQP